MASDGFPSGPDSTLYLYTSLTAGSSHIITATSRLETILKANKVAFRAIDCATDEKARQLWSRRSKGKKIPGLVKYGQVIGDLEEVEEWNEYGELRENIDNVSDLFGDTPMTDTPMPPPAPITIKDPLNKITEPVPRSTSETRHISISDPKDKDAQSPVRDISKKDESPMSIALRQAGAEAAAKAGQRKASTASSLKSSSVASTVPTKRDSTEFTPTPAAIKLSVDAEEPAEATEVTDSKTPGQLAAEGAKRISVDKINEHVGGDLLNPSSATHSSKSTEEQMLALKRTSSITKEPSRLSQETSIDDAHKLIPEHAVTSEVNLPATQPDIGGVRPREHRGSSLGDASVEKIKEIEQKSAINEESEEDSDNGAIDTSTPPPAVQSSDKAEAEATKGLNPQDQKAKDAEAAGVSALFLRPDANLHRLSADSASVYSFFDSSFSPAPLFSDTRPNLDLNFKLADFSVEPLSLNTKPTINGRDSPDTTSSTDKSAYNSEPEPEGEQQAQESNIEYEEPVEVPTPLALRTPARRQQSEPLLLSIHSTSSRPSTSRNKPASDPPSPATGPTSVSSAFSPSPITPLPSTLTSPLTQTQSLATPATPDASSPASPSGSRSLRFKKSLRSLRSKTSMSLMKQQQSASSSPVASSPFTELPPNLPPQKQLRAVSEQMQVKKKSSMRNLLCF